MTDPAPKSGNPSSASVPAASPSGTKGPSQSTRSYMFIESAGSSMMYEKDGNWKLGKIPPYLVTQINRPVKKPDGAEPEDDEEEESDPVPVDKALIAIDALTGYQTIPCNLCDIKERCPNENEIVPVWNWLYAKMNDVVGKVKEYKRDMDQRDVSCGEDPNGEPTPQSTKGTQSMMWVDRQ